MDDKELRSDLRMDAYYYGFNETGVVEIDRILSSVAIAGKAYHHTEGWSDHCEPWRTWQRGKSHIGFIQNAAIAAAARLTALAEEVARLRGALAPFARFGEGMTLASGGHDVIYLGGTDDDGSDFSVRKAHFIEATHALAPAARKDGERG